MVPAKPKAKSPTVFPLVRKPGAGRPKKSPFVTKRSIAVQRYLRDLKLAAPWLELADMPLARRFCELQVLIAALFFEIRSNGMFDTKKQPRFVLETYRRAVLAQAAVARELGLSPLSRRQLALSATGEDLAALLAAKPVARETDNEDDDERKQQAKRSGFRNG